jgi:hypothetical protein
MRNLSFSILGCLAAAATSALAQSYSIDWYKIAGGGGTSTGSVYTVTGTIGQHDAGAPMTGGNYSLQGGFWALYAVQTEGAPTLRIFLTSTNTAVVCWQAGSTNWTLQSTLNVAAGPWNDSTSQVSQINGTNQVLVASPSGNRYFRLHKQ